MDFELWWLFILIPVVFALGWGASGFQLRQWRQEQLDAPRSYFKGLNFLLNEQQDKAIDAFIEAIQYDPNTTDLHFALGNLFRRRGEYERAVRVHQHLLSRADLPASQRDCAQYALAQDYLKAGLLDHAEKALRALEKAPTYTSDARLLLLSLYERARDWPQAIEVTFALEEQQAGNFASKRAHYHCEMASQALLKGDLAKTIYEFKQAHTACPSSPRPLIEMARYYLKQNEIQKTFACWADLLKEAPQAVSLIATEVSQFILNLEHTHGQTEQKAKLDKWRKMGYEILDAAYLREVSLDLLTALVNLDEDNHQRHHRILSYLEYHQSVIACAELLTTMQNQEPSKELNAIRRTLERAAKPLDRYRCVTCGFEASHYFWQCPGCQSWDSYPPKRIEEF